MTLSNFGYDKKCGIEYASQVLWTVMKPKNNILTLTCKYFLKCFIASCHACQHIFDFFHEQFLFYLK